MHKGKRGNKRTEGGETNNGRPGNDGEETNGRGGGGGGGGTSNRAEGGTRTTEIMRGRVETMFVEVLGFFLRAVKQ